MNDDTQKALIIVDANILINLSAPIPKERLTIAGRLRQPTYLDLLVAASEADEISAIEIPKVIIMECTGRVDELQISTSASDRSNPKCLGFEARNDFVRNSSKKKMMMER